MLQICVFLLAKDTGNSFFHLMFTQPETYSCCGKVGNHYVVDPVDKGVDAAVAHGQDVAPHPHVVDASEAATLDFV